MAYSYRSPLEDSYREEEYSWYNERRPRENQGRMRRDEYPTAYRGLYGRREEDNVAARLYGRRSDDSPAMPPPWAASRRPHMQPSRYQDQYEEEERYPSETDYYGGPRESEPYYRGNSSRRDYPNTSSGFTSRFKPTQYPRELTELFEADDCKLCGVELPSPIVAKMHYSGKTHMKKVKAYLTNWAEQRGVIMPEVVEPDPSVTARSLPDHCEICDVRLVSINDKLLHFSGKQHQKNERDPANAKKKRKMYDTIDLTGRFGIGEGFSSKMAKLATEVSKEEGDDDDDDLDCVLCDVKCLSKEQLDAHLNGKRHKEKMAKAERGEEERKEDEANKKARPFHCSLCNVYLETNYLLKLHFDGKRHKKAVLKKEMTGAGADYCEVCDIDFTSFDTYQMHIKGKKHEKKCKQMYGSYLDEADDKPSVACKFCPYVGNVENHECDESLAKMDEYENLEDKFLCHICSMVFDTEDKLTEHKSSRRHVMCVMNKEEGEKIIEDLRHWYCFLCKKQCRTAREFTDHMFDKKHMLLSEETAVIGSHNLFQCTVCAIIMDLEAKEEHLRDRKHLKESCKKDTIKLLTKLANDDIQTTAFHCKNCNEYLSSFVTFSQHLLGDKHLDVMVTEKLAKFK